jgi:exonuclease SbcC
LKHISTHYNSEKQTKFEHIKEIISVVVQKKAGSRASELEITGLEKKLTANKSKLQSHLGALEKEIARAEESGRHLADERDELKKIEERLAGKDFALAQQETIHHINDELAVLNYDPQKHDLVRLELNELQKYEIPRHQLEEAEKLIGQEKEDLSRSEKASDDLQQGLQNDTLKKLELSSEITALPQVSNTLAGAELEAKRLTASQKQIQEKIGGIKGKLEYYARRESEKAEKEKQLNLTIKEASIYHELAEAFGKKGIQALLIETALPEIEIEANRLLAKMTDNRMHVKIETQKETQKGDVTETLDIKISDELGIRNYEMYSGGEAFRINFAIRIALSRLLAHRAGAPLPTLIIDEGFGTQDASGIEKLKEAINSIQDDFEKILVITHVDELRDAFPARIDVVKTAEGSTFSLN